MTASPHGAQTTYSYTTSPPTSTATTNGRFVKTTYDGLGRTIKVERGDTAVRFGGGHRVRPVRLLALSAK